VGDKSPANSSKQTMRAWVASFVAAILLSLLTVCPMTACVTMSDLAAAHHGCCHKPQSQPARCPMPTVQDCAYFILERGKMAQAIEAVSPVSVTGLALDLAVADLHAEFRVETRLPDFAGLYLRVRTLLI